MRQNLFGHCAAKNLITKYRVSGWSDPKTKIVQCKQQMVSGQAKLLWICFDKGKIQSYQNHDRHPRYVCQQWTHDSPKIVTNVNILSRKPIIQICLLHVTFFLVACALQVFARHGQSDDDPAPTGTPAAKSYSFWVLNEHWLGCLSLENKTSSPILFFFFIPFFFFFRLTLIFFFFFLVAPHILTY